MSRILFALLFLAAAVPARAEVTLGALLSLTGPGAGLGIPERNTIDLLPRTIAGQPIRWVVLDDTSDTSAAVRDARKMIDEEHVDAIIGTSTTPTSIAILDAIGSAGVPAISLSGSSAVIDPPEGNRRWAFKLIPSERVATVQIVDQLVKTGKKTLGNIGFANSLGDGYINALNAQAGPRGIQTVADVRYNPGDTSVTPQVLRLIAAKPDAVFVAASSTPATTPIVELRARGYTGPIYTVQGIAGPDALRVGGKALDGTMFSSVPVLVAEQMPDGNAVRATALDYVKAYEGKFGAGSRSLFGATLWDAFLLVQAATPTALKAGAPGTPAFRTALRDAMEHVTGLAASEAIFSLTPADHSGAQADSQVMVEIRDGRLSAAEVIEEAASAAATEIAYLEAGAGVPIVFLHGIGGAARQFSPQIAHFREHFHAIAWDMPGYGASAPLPDVTMATLAAALGDFLRMRRLERPVLVGHSIGGMIAQQLLVEDPQAARALVLAQTSAAFGGKDPAWADAFVAARLAPLDAGHTMAELAPGMVAALLGEEADQEGVQIAVDCIAQTPDQAYRDTVLAMPGFDLRHALPTIAVPTLVLAGAADQNAPAPAMQRMAERIPGARYVVLEGAGHLAHLEQPARFNAVLDEFLKEIGL